jgi:hypothetical protein
VKWWSDRRKLREDAVLAVLFEHQRKSERRHDDERWLHMQYISTRTCLTEAQTFGALSRLQLAGFIQTDGDGGWRFKVPDRDSARSEPRTYPIRCRDCGTEWVQMEGSTRHEWHEVGCPSGQWLVEARSRQVMTYGYD